MRMYFSFDDFSWAVVVVSSGNVIVALNRDL